MVSAQEHGPIRIVPHARTLRKARENVKWMVNDGVSHLKTRNYLHRFVLWWVKATGVWRYDELLLEFIKSCWDEGIALLALGLLYRSSTLRDMSPMVDCQDAA